MRNAEFAYAAPDAPSDGLRHRARQFNFDDQSIFSYSSPNKNWWGYA